MPRVFSRSTKVSKAMFLISGSLLNLRHPNYSSEYSLKQYPSRVLPARPALCFADDWLICPNFIVENFVFWSYCIYLSHPGSMTTLTPSIVMAVYAILEAKINLCSFVFEKAFFWSSGVSFPCKGITMNTLWLSFFLNIYERASIYPVSAQNTKIWPLYFYFSTFLYVKSSF